jgi:hypothetical protein
MPLSKSISPLEGETCCRYHGEHLSGVIVSGPNRLSTQIMVRRLHLQWRVRSPVSTK